MKNGNKLLRMLVVSLMIALGVVISPILRVEGMCPMAHFINIVCSVLLGPWYSLFCAIIIGIIRMITMGIPPIALTGAIFGAFLSGVFYRMFKGNLLMAVLGEILGTGVIGAIMSYPVMTFIWGKEGLSWFFYVPSFICGTLIGGSIAYVFLKKLSGNGILSNVQRKLLTESYADKSSLIGNSISIATIGVIGYVIINLSGSIFKFDLKVCSLVSRIILSVFITVSIVYYIVKKLKKEDATYDKSIS